MFVQLATGAVEVTPIIKRNIMFSFLLFAIFLKSKILY